MTFQTRKYKSSRKTRKTKGGRRNGNNSTGLNTPLKGRADDYSDCKHIHEESHTFPSKLIQLKIEENNSYIGPAKPFKFYDCVVTKRDRMTKEPIQYAGRSCENKRFDGMKINKDDIEREGTAYNKKELVAWCCPMKNPNPNPNH